MEIIKQSRSLLVLLAVALTTIALFAVGTYQPVTSKANDKQPVVAQNKDAEKKQQGQTQGTTTTGSYKYIAQPGDSYSVLARKAVQTYGILNNVKLSQAQIIAAETQLTSKAGFPELNQGQTVEFSIANVKSAVESAQKLNAGAQTAWQKYVAVVDFNTNDNGEASGQAAAKK